MISLGVDLGGTGCKCAAFRDDGTQLALAYTEYPLAAGAKTLPPDILVSSVFQVIARCSAGLSDPSDIAAITVSSFGESFVALDEDGMPLTHILLYFADSQNSSFARVVREVGEDRFMEITRILPDASYSLSKILYTGELVNRPVWKYLFMADYICFRLCGSAATDVSLACRSLLYDVKHRCWSQELLNAAGISLSQLPQVLPTGSQVGALSSEMAGQLGLPAGTRVIIGSHDQIVNALGAGVAKEGDAVDTSGTCECVTPLFSRIPESRDFLKHNFACVPYLEHRGYVTYAYNISAGSVIRWYRDSFCQHLQQEAQLLGGSIYDLLNETCPDEPSSLLLLPYLQGMGGTPDVDASASGFIAGLTTDTRLPDLYRAILEGITFEMRYNQEKLSQSGISIQRLFACGGGARSPVWLQIKADILEREILPLSSRETGAMGSAILGLSAATGESAFPIAQRFVRYGKPVRPRPKYQELYRKRYEQFKLLRSIYLEQHQKEGNIL